MAEIALARERSESDPRHPFLADCLGGRDSAQLSGMCRVRDLMCTRMSIDWDSIFSIASSEAVLPALYPSMSALGLLDQVPSDIAQSLEAVTQLNAERNHAILSELKSAVAILNREKVQPLILKGVAYLLAGVYSEPGSRYLFDVDLAIPEAQMPIAQAALAEGGFRPDGHDMVACFRHHHVPVRRPGGISFELHHSLTLHRSGRHILTIPEMLYDSTLLDWEGLRVRIPSPDHLVTHLILHSQLQHPYRERIWPPLRAMYDLLLLNRCLNINWPSIEQRFRAAGQRSTFRLHLLQIEKTFGMERPLPILLTPFESLRWFRRNVLNRWPNLRFVDPVCLLLSTLSRRLQLLRSILSTKGGWKSALQVLLSPSFYRRLISEVTLRSTETS